jgi:hypothetical protein
MVKGMLSYGTSGLHPLLLSAIAHPLMLDFQDTRRRAPGRHELSRTFMLLR